MADGRFPYLFSLPPELLTPIFLEAKITIRNLVICRELLPYTLNAVYIKVDLWRKSQILAFQKAVQDPERAKLVKTIGISRSRDIVPAHLRSATARRHKSPHWNVSQDILVDILRRMVSLREFYTFSEGLAAFAFPGFSQQGVAEHLEHVGVRLDEGEDFLEGEKACFIGTSRLPALKTISVSGGSCHQPPFDLASFAEASPTTRPLAMRSWSLDVLELTKFESVGAECRYIFESFTALRVLVFHVERLSPAFAKYLPLLPQTLEHLDIGVLGSPRSPYLPIPARELPKLNTIGALFPNLRRLVLDAHVFTPALFGNLHHASQLEILCLGHHAPFTVGDLIPLLQPGSATKLRSLKILDLHACQEAVVYGDGTVDTASSRWPAGYATKGGKKLVALCAEENVELKGGATCALGICDCEGGHHRNRNC